MIQKRHFMLMVLTTLSLTVVVFSVLPLRRGSSGAKPPYDPWLDTDDNGATNMGDVVSVLDAFGSTGTPLEKAYKLYDSGWLNLTGQTGENYTIIHNLNLNGADIIVDARKRDPLGWNKTYGGTSDDGAFSVVQTGDGGYALAGATESFGAGLDDFWLVKTDAIGNMLWNQTYGGPSNDRAYSLVQASDGGYALAGMTESFGAGDADAWFVKTDAAGNMQWNETYGGTEYDEGVALVQTGDGGYALAVRTDSFGAGWGDFWLVKTDGSGNMLWNMTYGGTTEDDVCSVVQTGDGGYALAGSTNSFGAGSYDFWLVKTDASGNALWNKTYGGPSSDGAWGLVQTSDGGYALAGIASFGAGAYDSWLIKTDAAGNMQWNETYGGTGYDAAVHLVQTSDGGYALAGCTNSFGAGSTDFWLVKANTESGLGWVCSTSDSITVFRGATDWSYVRVQIWKHR